MSASLSEREIERVMADTGMARMQAVNHLRQREELRRMSFDEQLSRVRKCLDEWGEAERAVSEATITAARDLREIMGRGV